MLFSCEDFALGDKFLQKPPSKDVTIDTIFSNAEYARRILWNSYTVIPFGHPIANTYLSCMRKGNTDGLTDLAHTYVNDSGERLVYYPGKYSPECENYWRPDGIHVTKYRFLNFEAWTGIRHSWILVENVDKVPDMDQSEKNRLKAEAKILVAIQYAEMFRHYGGLPIVDHSLGVDDTGFPKRSTVQETVDFIVRLLDEAIACEDLPWAIGTGELANWAGRVTKASAMALKVRVLLFAASPLFNDTEPYYPGKASEELLTWFGGKDETRWRKAADAAEEFFKMMDQKGFYRLIQKEDVRENTYCNAFREGYYSRGSTETLISSHRGYYRMDDDILIKQAIRWGGPAPTKEYFDMFPMADGSDFDWNNNVHAKNPFVNRDPRLAETIFLDGINDYQGGKIELFEEDPEDKVNYPKSKHFGVVPMDKSSLEYGMATYKWGLDRNAAYGARKCHWPIIRLPEIYLSYAEAMNELNETNNANSLGKTAYDYVNMVRNRVGLRDLPKGLDKDSFREAVMRERACEFGFEQVRFFDLIRWKREDIFTKRLHGLRVYKHKDTKEYKFKVYEMSGNDERAWQKSGGFSPKIYLSAFPPDEVNKGYGLVQNPGWE